ncbi:MAG: tetraacyldisaccharide 4'-kinase [Pseudomonadota bacterium]
MSRKAPGFWWPEAGRPPSTRDRMAQSALYPASVIYGWIAGNRMLGSGSRAECPVICVGNFVAGGAGKTPTALYVAERLTESGLKPAFVSRGYTGTLSNQNVQVDLDSHTAQEVGDEPLLLARVAPTFVGAERSQSIRSAFEAGADIVVLDDGFQNPSVIKDFNIVVVDAAWGVGNGLCHPAGPLRVPLAKQISFLDVIVVIGEGRAANAVIRKAARQGKQLCFAKLEITMDDDLRDRPVLAFAGIGQPEKFKRSLEDKGAKLADFLAFGDHHLYTETDAKKLLARASELSAALVTTEKDRARLRGASGTLGDLAEVTTAIPVTLRFEDATLLDRTLETVIDQWRRDLLMVKLD